MASDRPRVRQTVRGVRLGGVAAKHGAREAMLRVQQPFRTAEAQAAARDRQVLRLADDLVNTLGTMKGAALKLGQVISLLNLGLSTAAAREDFSRRLAPLYQSVPPVADGAMLALLASELGPRRSRLTAIEGPIAAASLGQVYRATLPDGRPVAVKVQYPTARHAVRADLKNLALLTKLHLRRQQGPDIGLEDVVAEVSEQITTELDYRRELASHEEVWSAHRDHPVFVIPRPIAELCTERVLVTEYLDGTNLERFATDAEQSQRDRVGEAVYRFYCGSMYTTGRFCADPHPGNIIVLDDGRVGFVDFGLYVRMTEPEIGLERDVLAAVLANDATEAHRLASAAGFIVDPDAMPADMALDYMTSVAAWYLTPGVVQVTDKLVYQCLAQAVLPGSSYRHGAFRQHMPRAHAFSRRTEMSVAGLLGTLGAQGGWRDIVSEWISDQPPTTDMGRAIASWRDHGTSGADRIPPKR